MVHRLMSVPFWVMAAWSAALAWLLYGDHYHLFLAPRFGFLVGAGLTLCFIYMISFFKTAAYAGKNRLGKGLILILPVLFIFSAGENTLGNFALSKRVVTAPSGSLSRDTSQISRNPAGIPRDQSNAEPLSVSISDLITNWKKFSDQQISVEGLFARDLPGHENLSAVFRYLVSCCAADALPVGIFIRRKSGTAIESNTWVRVSGKVFIDKIGETQALFMETDQITKTPMPSKSAVYLYN